MKVQDILGTKLDGWSLEVAHHLELKHGLMGFFPAIYKSGDEIIIVTDKNLLVEIAKHLTPRVYKVTSFLALVHDDGRVVALSRLVDRFEMFSADAAWLDTQRDTYTEICIGKALTAERLAELLATEKKPFKWAPGLVGNDMSGEEFIETLREAARQGPP